MIQALGAGASSCSVSEPEEALRIARRLGDKRTIGHALGILGWLANRLNPAAAPALYEEAIELCRETGDSWQLAGALRNWGLSQWLAGNGAGARLRLREALSIAPGGASGGRGAVQPPDWRAPIRLQADGADAPQARLCQAGRNFPR